MFFYLSKLIDFLLHPLIWVIILLCLSLFKKQSRRRFLILALTVLYLFSNEFLFNEVSRLYESKAVERTSLQEHYSAAIVLGGLSSYHEEFDQLEFQGSADRLFDMLPFYFEGKIDKIIIAGGSGRLIQDQKESPYLKDYLIKIGVDETDILNEDQSRNTYENAVYAKKLIENHQLNPPYILSTSAAHMPRSKAVFEKQGLMVDIYPVDYYSREREFNPDRLFMPKAYVLNNWAWMIHEWVGWIFYKLMGYC